MGDIKLKRIALPAEQLKPTAKEAEELRLYEERNHKDRINQRENEELNKKEDIKEGQKNRLAEINELVNEKGTGISRKKPSDQNGEKKAYEYYDQNVFFKIYEQLMNDRGYYESVVIRKGTGILSSEEAVYASTIFSASADYDPGKGMKFTTYFIEMLRYAYLDQNKTDKCILLESQIKIPKGEEEEKELFENYISRYENKPSAEKEFDQSLLFEDMCRLLYEILRFVQTSRQAATKKAIMKLLYTGTLVELVIKYGEYKANSYKNEQQIYDGMDHGFVDYIYTKMVQSIQDIPVVPLKQIGQLIDYYLNEPVDKELIDRYDSIWGVQYKNNRGSEVKFPISNVEYLAYYFIYEYENSDRKVIPEVHASSYISQYRNQFDEVKRGFGKSIFR